MVAGNVALLGIPNGIAPTSPAIGAGRKGMSSLNAGNFADRRSAIGDQDAQDSIGERRSDTRLFLSDTCGRMKKMVIRVKTARIVVTLGRVMRAL